MIIRVNYLQVYQFFAKCQSENMKEEFDCQSFNEIPQRKLTGACGK